MADATLSITIPEAIKARVLDALCYQYGYKDTIVDAQGATVDNPVTKPQFAKNVITKFCKEVTQAYEANKAGEVARIAAASKANSEIIL